MLCICGLRYHYNGGLVGCTACQSSCKEGYEGLTEYLLDETWLRGFPAVADSVELLHAMSFSGS